MQTILQSKQTELDVDVDKNTVSPDVEYNSELCTVNNFIVFSPQFKFVK